MKSYKILIFFICLIFISCSGNDYEKSYQLDNDCWDAEKSLQFNVDIQDTNQLYNMYFSIRNSDSYSYSNIFMFVHVLYPDNTEKVDTVEGILADSKGKWLGTGSGKYRNSEFLYKSRVFFPQTGKYVFTVEHAMRVQSLEGIASVGFQLETVNPD